VKPRLVVFDLDGTLIDSIGDIAASANQSLVEAYGEGARLPAAAVRSFVGHGARQLVERCVEAAQKPAADVSRVFERFLSIYASRLTATTRLYPGMAAALDRIATDARLAILTNKPGGMSRAIVRDLALESRFFSIVGGDDLPTRKPDPEGLLKIAEEAGVPPAEAALVGDSGVDIKTARNAGALAIGVLWGYDREGVIREGPDLTVDDPGALALALKP
jgi:phosphoglycolate phosphatase